MKRLHVHVSVPNLQQGIEFYRTLFDQEPAVAKTDYAKWMLDDPAVNFAISAGSGNKGVNHLGLQVDTDEEVDAIRQRLQSAHIIGMEENDANCCYTNSNKYWTMDPAGIPWEQFHTLSEIPTFGDSADTGIEAGACGCTPASYIKNTVAGCCT